MDRISRVYNDVCEGDKMTDHHGDSHVTTQERCSYLAKLVFVTKAGDYSLKERTKGGEKGLMFLVFF